MTADHVPADAFANDGAARIHEQGYRRYDGIRLGPSAAVRAVFLHTIRVILGFKRKARSKIIPVGVVALAVLPAVAFTGALLVIPDFAAQIAQEILPGPEAYVGGIAFLTYIGAAIAGPTALCGDRLHGSLTLYLASPLTRRTYLLGKAAAIVLFLMAVTVLPSVVYVLGIALSGVQDSSVSSVLADLLQVVVAGSLIAVGYTTLSMAAASLTDRQGAASGLIVGFSMVIGIFGDVLVHALNLPASFAAINVNAALTDAAIHVHGERALIPGPAAFAASAVWIGAFTYLVLRRYDRLQVTR